MKRPWFTWLSLVGFLGLSLVCGVRVAKEKRTQLWGPLMKKILGLWVGLILAPCLVLVFGYTLSVGIAPQWAQSTLLLSFVYLYFIGMYAAGNLYTWYRANLKNS